eukprot:3902561-Prymnesium_polylepis.1
MLLISTVENDTLSGLKTPTSCAMNGTNITSPFLVVNAPNYLYSCCATPAEIRVNAEGAVG